MSEGLIIYMHILSPYAKTVIATANHLDIPHTERHIDLRKNEHKSEWYLKINPNGQVPAIKDGDHTMAESIDIAKYLIESRDKGTPLYPNDDAEKREDIDRVLEISQELGKRTTDVLLNVYWGRILRKTNLTVEERQEFINKVYETYGKLNTHLEERNTKYFNSNFHPSLADFHINNLMMSLVEKNIVQLDNYPALKQWLEISSQVPALSDVIRRSNAAMKKIRFLVRFVLPMIRCLT
mmetsp:Transcript_881/g.872  ORF Transcript_881/g.872 Transcript_881/m.872 type:complete len:238 (-) Transcript_881:78-791(-)